MILITETISLKDEEIQEEFIRASGPGGQNVNKVSTAVRLRFSVKTSPSLPDEVRERLIQLAGNRMTEEGVLLIEAKRFRSQEKNRKDAITRLMELIRKATVPPKPRRPTKPSKASKERRLANKQHRSVLKKDRRPTQHWQE